MGSGTRELAAPGERQLVATVGPTSWNHIAALVEAGASALRLNTSHLTTWELAQAARAIRHASARSPLVLDLQGAKMRLGRFLPRDVVPGQRVRFALESEAESEFAPPADGATAAPERDRALPREEPIPLPHPELFASLQPGEILSVDDARLKFRLEVVLPDVLEATCLSRGVVQPRKGVNRADHPVDPEDLSLADLRAIEATASLGNVAYALSFVRTAAELRWVRDRVPEAQVVAKIERREAIANLAELCDEADALWICRGDLGAQLGMSALANAVRGIRPGELAAPVLMAGQVFEHLTQHGDPTRSEVCHLGDLLARGYAGVVLSDETAIGVAPVHAVRQVRALLSELE